MSPKITADELIVRTADIVQRASERASVAGATHRRTTAEKRARTATHMLTGYPAARRRLGDAGPAVLVCAPGRHNARYRALNPRSPGPAVATAANRRIVGPPADKIAGGISRRGRND